MGSRSADSGLIFSISRTSCEDGPGIRTTVFLKGCALRCVWCHSPQSQGDVAPRLSYYQNRCIACNACFSACPNEVHGLIDGRRTIRWHKCRACGACIEACPAKALEMVGKWMAADEVMEVVRRDASYYAGSGGGVTFSGGEPAAQPDFLLSCARLCKSEGIHTALDTCGYADWTAYEQVLPYFDLVLYDVKHADPAMHREDTGADNARIQENLRKIDRMRIPIWIRIPLIPGRNDSERNISQIASLVRDLRTVERITLLPFNSAAGAKYGTIGRIFELEGTVRSKARELEILESLSRTGIPVDLRC
jgi:pyruvate formate lyase activating enzyme